MQIEELAPDMSPAANFGDALVEQRLVATVVVDHQMTAELAEEALGMLAAARWPARYLLKHKDELDKTQIGEYLGREAEYQNGFSLRVLHEYARLLDFAGLVFDDAIRFFLSGFRLPGEAQKVSLVIVPFSVLCSWHIFFLCTIDLTPWLCFV